MADWRKCTRRMAVVGTIAAMSGSARAAALASDSAADPAYAAWEPGDNGGTGWGGGWTFKNQSNTTLVATNGNRGWFVGNSINNNSGGTDPNGDGDINTAGRAWGTYSNTTDHVLPVRPFNGALSVGQAVQFSMDNGSISTSNVVGIRFLSDANDAGSRVFEFRFVGGDSFYTIIGSPNVTTTIPFSREGLRGEYELTGPSTYKLTVTRLADNSQTVWTGANANANPIVGLAFRNQFAGSGAGSDAFFNSIAIVNVPEPALLATIMLFAGGALARRRAR